MNSEASFMARAVELARRGLGHTRPNPSVGAVVVKNGKIIGEGWHRKAGGDHAEVAAIKDAKGRTKGAVIYVTLEPCSKPGRVGACTDAIIAAGISRVVYAIPDPNPRNRGKAKRALFKAGVGCECWALDKETMNRDAHDEELLCRQDAVRRARQIVAPFAKHVATGIPYVTVKIAMSLDGKICDDSGNARWISSQASRRVTGAMRETADAIMVGAETLRKDNPSLLSHQKANPDLVRVIVSRSGRIPGNAKVFTDGAPNRTLVFDDAKKALIELGKAGITHVICEGGFNLARSLADQGLVDEWITVLAPIVVGSRPIGKAGEMNVGPCVRLVGSAPSDAIITYRGSFKMVGRQRRGSRCRRQRILKDTGR